MVHSQGNNKDIMYSEVSVGSILSFDKKTKSGMVFFSRRDKEGSRAPVPSPPFPATKTKHVQWL